MYLTIHPENPQGRHILKAVEILNNDGVIIYPTDTIYGIGCSIFSKKAIEKIYSIKKQNPIKPFSFICSDLSNISEYAIVSNAAYRVMRHLVPGPFTFILPASRLKQLPKSLISKRKTVGIRVPNNLITQTIIKELGHPILSASVTDNDGNIISNPEIMMEKYGNQVDMILDGGISILEPSTVLDFTEETPVVIREGAGKINELIHASE